MSANGKKGKETVSKREYQLGDVVLAKVKGYPFWPGHVVDVSEAPETVKKLQPSKGKGVVLVQFFPVGDYAWTAPRDMSLLPPKEIEAYLSGSKKKGDLHKGYTIAADPTEWKRNFDAVAAKKAKDYAEAMAILAEEEEGDQLDDDMGEEAAAAPKDDGKGKKRKRKSENGDSAKAPKAKKAATEEKAKKPKVEKLTKGRAATKSQAAYSEDEAEPSTKKAKVTKELPPNEDPGLKTVRDWRHKLQKVFLGNKGPLSAAEMPKCAEYFDAMEKFDMRKEWLTESKLGKVLKHINALVDGAIPQEDEFNFRSRAAGLANKWSQALSTAAPSNGEASHSHVEVAAPPADVEMAEPTPAVPVVETVEAVAPPAPAPIVEAPPAAPQPVVADPPATKLEPEVLAPTGADVAILDVAEHVNGAVAPTPLESSSAAATVV